MGVLEHRTIVELHATAVSVGLSTSRNALLSGVSPALVANITMSPSPAAQLLADLSALNAADRIAGVVPISTWLANAKALTSALPQASVFDRALEVAQGAQKAPAAPAHFFLSYRRQGEEAALAGRLHKALEGIGNTVFIDVGMVVGSDWAKTIEENIEQCDVFVVLVSAESIAREMVLAEVRRAHRRAHATGRPLIVPVRVQYDGPLDYELDAYIGRLQYARWDKPEDDGSVLADIERALKTWDTDAQPHDRVPARRSLVPAVPMPAPTIDPRFVIAPGGTDDIEDPLYVLRRSDQKVLVVAQAPKAQTLVIRGPRQRGKSSLLVRYLAACRDKGKRVAYVDFQVFSGADFETYTDFLTALAEAVVQLLEIDATVPPIQRSSQMTTFFQKQVLKAVAGPVVLAIDEVDRIYNRSYRSDFFTMLRSWHNSRALKPEWKALDLALVISTLPGLLIDAAYQSPFNVGENIDLDSLTLDECRALNRVSPRSLTDAQLDELYDLLRGHPYLTRLTYHHILADAKSFDDIVTDAAEPYGPYGDHLRALLSLLVRDARLLPALQQIITHGTVSDAPLADRLHSAGLVRTEKGRHYPSNRLYAQFFKTIR